MPILSTIAATTLTSALASAPPVDQPAPPTTPHAVTAGETGARITNWIRSAESIGFSGAILAAIDGKVVAAQGVGDADLDGTVPITPDALFEIASATKQFTAAAVMVLVEEGKLSLDDSIKTHLPGVPDDCAAITIRHLLQHTSGIPGTNSSGGGDDLAAVLPTFLRGGPTREPGTHFEYWNQGYALVTEIIARAADQEYVTFCRQRLFAPAGMRATCFTGDAPPDGAVVTVGGSQHGPPRSALEHPYGSYGFQYRGMGGAVTSVRDLWRWDRALHADTVLGAEAKAALFEPGLNDYALGWFVRRTPGGRLTHSHGGGVRGFACEIRRYPEADGCVIVLCNRDDIPAPRIAQALEEILFDEPATIPKPPRPLDDATADALTGTYHAEQRKAVLTIERAGPATRLSIHWSPGGPTSHTFVGKDDNGDLLLHEWTSPHPIEVLQYDRDGAVHRLTILGSAYQRAPAPAP